MPDTPHATSFVVVLRPGATETEATVIRNALRAMTAVASVEPVRQTPALDTARQQAKADLRAELTPIFAGLVEDVKGTLDATTEELVKITDPGQERPVEYLSELAKLRGPTEVPPPPAPRPVRAARPSTGTWHSVR